MNKFSLYLILILIYLGLSKSFSPSENKITYIKNEKVFSNFFPTPPVSIILIDHFQTGFLIKTYFQKYRIIHGFKEPYEMVVRTSRQFWKKNYDNLGMSIFRKSEDDGRIQYSPMPPGSLFIGNPAYGTWEYKEGIKTWAFHKTYRGFIKLFGWNGFTPNYDFYETIKIHESHQNSFYGHNNEFGSNGSITKSNFNFTSVKNTGTKETKIRDYFSSMFSLPPFKLNTSRK